MRITSTFFKQPSWLAVGTVSVFIVCGSFANTLFGCVALLQEPAGEATKTGAKETSDVGFSAAELLISYANAVNGKGERLVYPASNIFDVDGDGVQELLVGTINGHFTKYENAAKEGEKPNWRDPEFLNTSAGKRIKLDNCWAAGMYPQFVDINNDGFKDIVTGTYYGYAWWILGSEKGFSQAQPIKDKSGAKIGLPEREESDADVIASAVAVDWDRDGDLDLLLGGLLNGGLYLRRNEGTSSKPVFSTECEPVKAGDDETVVQIGDGIQSPTVVDWDGDGHLDILVGCSNAGVFWFRNQSTTGEFKLSAAKTLIKSDERSPMTDGDGNEVAPNSSCYVHACDYDGDDDLDLLVSGIATWETPPEKKPKSPEEKQKIAELEEINLKFDTMLPESLTQEEYEKVMESEEYAELEERSMKAYKAVKDFLPGFDSGHSVWIFRNQKTKLSTQK